MKILIATDSFKSSLTAADVCKTIADTLANKLPIAEFIIKPMADGGEGTAKAMLASIKGKWVKSEVMGPLPDMNVEAGFAWFEETQTALVEMACASGIELLRPDQHNPMKTTTYGTGQLIAEALKHNPKEILVAIGGSATVDGGVGAAAALGWDFYDKQGNNIPLGGKSLCDIHSFENRYNFTTNIEVLCDVENPLLGNKGAAAVFGPQKGASAEDVKILEEGLSNLCMLVKKKLNKDINCKGCGAAGGLAAGLVAFTNASITSGITKVIEVAGISENIKDCDIVITGEGCFDSQSLDGKVVCGIAKQAINYGKKVYVIAGKVLLEEAIYKQFGIQKAFSCVNNDMETVESIKNPVPYLQRATERLAGYIRE